MTFFTDRDLGSNIFPNILRAAGIQVERHTDHFPHDAPDQVWIPAVAARGWLVVTHDARIRYVTVEREAVMRTGLGMFLIVGQASHAELARNFVNTFPLIEHFASTTPKPFIAKIFRPSPVSLVASGSRGRVELWVS